MSMPTDGSSMISSFTPAAIHFATDTFCWLPPERLPMVWWSDGVLTSSFSQHRPDMHGNRLVAQEAKWPASFATP